MAQLTATCRADSVPSLTIGVAEGPEEYQFHRMFGATQLSDGRIVIVNQGSEEIRYYAPDGAFLRRAGRAGQGPGEFSNAFYLWPARGDTVFVGDYDPWQFEVFAPDGTWLRSVQPSPAYVNSPGVIVVLADGRSVLAEDPFPLSRGPGFEMQEYVLVVHAADGTLLDTLLHLPNARLGTLDGRPESVRIYPLFESFAEVAGRGARLAVGHGSRPELHLYSGESVLTVESITTWSGDDRSITPDAIDAARASLAVMYPDMREDERKHFVGPLIDPARPVADSFPAFQEVMIGSDGRIWVQQYRRPGDEIEQRWMAFDPRGRFACRTAVPVGEEVLEFGDDLILVEDPDPDGVERVSRLRLGSLQSE